MGIGVNESSNFGLGPAGVEVFIVNLKGHL